MNSVHSIQSMVGVGDTLSICGIEIRVRVGDTLWIRLPIMVYELNPLAFGFFAMRWCVLGGGGEGSGV